MSDETGRRSAGTGRDGRRRGARAADSVDRAYETIEALAVAYRLRPGERVNEVEMAARLACSRTPVRAALNRLVRDGFMTFRPNRGFYVRDMSPDDVRDLYELRAAIERSAIRLACERASDDAIEAAATAWEACLRSAAPLDAARVALADEALHLAIVRLSGNDRMVGTIERIGAQIRFYRRIDIETVPRRAHTFDEHAAILDALRRRDADRAGDLVERHITISSEHAILVTQASLAEIFGRAA